MSTARQQHNDQRAPTHEIHSITRSDINTHFGNSFPQEFGVARISGNHAVNAGLNTHPRYPVFQSQQPPFEGFRFDDLEHGQIVNHGLQISK